MNIYQRAIEHYGKHKQINKAIEELNELAVALSHYRDHKISTEELIKEIGDVMIMVEQMRIIYGIKVKEIHDSMKNSLDSLDSSIDRDERMNKYRNSLARKLYCDE